MNLLDKFRFWLDNLIEGEDIIYGASGNKYRVFRAPIYVGYWTMHGGVFKQPAEKKPNLLRRITHRVFLGWKWTDGLDGL